MPIDETALAANVVAALSVGEARSENRYAEDAISETDFRATWDLMAEDIDIRAQTIARALRSQGWPCHAGIGQEHGTYIDSKPFLEVRPPNGSRAASRAYVIPAHVRFKPDASRRVVEVRTNPGRGRTYKLDQLTTQTIDKLFQTFITLLPTWRDSE